MRVMPEATSRAPSARRTLSVRSDAPRPGRLRSLAARIWSGHRLFVLVLIPAVLLRADTELGYRWQAWFNDSFVYVEDTIHFNLDPTRVSGYSVWLKILEPLHSYAIVTILQHLMGLAVAVMIYALARHRFGAPAWLATLAAVPVLYDGFEIQLEHLILSDVPFLFVLMLATTLLLWDPEGPSTRRSAVIGLLLGLGAVLRSIGLPLLAIFAVYMIIKRFNWRRIVATVGVCLIPVLAYAGAFDLQHGQFAMSDATGVFLYSRVMTFAECSKMNVPADELWLCTNVPPDKRPIAQAYIWTLPGVPRWTATRRRSSPRYPTRWPRTSRSARSRRSRPTTPRPSSTTRGGCSAGRGRCSRRPRRTTSTCSCRRGCRSRAGTTLISGGTTPSRPRTCGATRRPRWSTRSR